MIVTSESTSPPEVTSLRLVPSFRSWQRDTVSRGLLPVIGVVGGRGKSTVVRMLDAVFNRAHLRTATWTNLGVEIRGRRQSGELAGWSLALARLAESSVDVAIQELHWSTVNAVGLPPHSYPVMVMTNMLGSLDAPSHSSDMRDASRAARKASSAVHPEGVLVQSADDPALSLATEACDGTFVLSSLSRESPLMRRHLEHDGVGIWQEQGIARAGSLHAAVDAYTPARVPSTMSAAAPHQVANTLIAAGIALALGIDADTTEAALLDYSNDPDNLPGSMNVFENDRMRAVVDRVCPSWHLRPLLRAVNPTSRNRLLTVIGALDSLPASDVQEVGRLIGRHPGAVIIRADSTNDSRENLDHLDRFKRGVASNDYPPLVITLPTERRALNRALKTARPGDILLALTGDDPGMAIRAIRRYLETTT